MPAALALSTSSRGHSQCLSLRESVSACTSLSQPARVCLSLHDAVSACMSLSTPACVRLCLKLVLRVTVWSSKPLVATCGCITLPDAAQMLRTDKIDKMGHRLYVSLCNSPLQLNSSRQGKYGSEADSSPPPCAFAMLSSTFYALAAPIVSELQHAMWLARHRHTI